MNYLDRETVEKFAKEHNFLKICVDDYNYAIATSPSEIGDHYMFCNFFIGFLGTPVVNGYLAFTNSITIKEIDISEYFLINRVLIAGGYKYDKKTKTIYKKDKNGLRKETNENILLKNIGNLKNNFF